MKITEVELYSNNIQFMKFSLEKINPNDEYVIKNITGLDADDIIPMYYGSGDNSNSKFYDYILKPRDIVMRIGLNPRFNLDETHGEIRDKIYRAISASRSGILTLKFFSNGIAMAQLFGRIVKFEANHFTKEPEVQVTFNCNEPLFKAINETVLTGLNETNPVYISDGESTAPHGFKFQIVFTTSSNTFTIQDAPSNPDWVFQIVPATPFANEDVLYLSSEKNNKYLYMDRGGVITHLMDKVYPTSIWPILFPGTNTFHIPEINAINWTQVAFYASYWGV